jgi:hypothetical protein
LEDHKEIKTRVLCRSLDPATPSASIPKCQVLFDCSGLHPNESITPAYRDHQLARPSVFLQPSARCCKGASILPFGAGAQFSGDQYSLFVVVFPCCRDMNIMSPDFCLHFSLPCVFYFNIKLLLGVITTRKIALIMICLVLCIPKFLF